ncbi:hypothetical protein LTR36_007470 [Oleoguttula mirabilis]|uniref:Uncharacterized protein n=1 Tax=Oleoguttula mirabilis TaxID=1507867 RepID=A0AAV9J9U8_9PEZI|nr:hypothetical protein LTR36_007470 [Oleoguttula mirabilis]
MADILKNPWFMGSAAYSALAYLSPQSLAPPTPGFRPEPSLESSSPTTFPSIPGAGETDRNITDMSTNRNFTAPSQPAFNDTMVNMSTGISRPTNSTFEVAGDGFAPASLLTDVNPIVLVCLLAGFMVLCLWLYDAAQQKAQHKLLDGLMDTVANAFEKFIDVNEELCKKLKALNAELKTSRGKIDTLEDSDRERNKKMADLEAKKKTQAKKLRHTREDNSDLCKDQSQLSVDVAAAAKMYIALSNQHAAAEKENDNLLVQLAEAHQEKDELESLLVDQLEGRAFSGAEAGYDLKGAQYENSQLMARINKSDGEQSALRTTIAGQESIITQQAQIISKFVAQARIDGAHQPMMLAAREEEKFVQDYEDQTCMWYTQHHNELDTVRAQVEAQNNEIVVLQQESEAQRAVLEKKDEQIKQLERTRERLQAELTDATQKESALEAKIVDRDEVIGEWVKLYNEQGEALVEKRQEVKSLEADIKYSDQKLREAGDDLRDFRWDAQKDSDGWKADNDDLEDRIDDLKAKLKNCRKQMSRVSALTASEAAVMAQCDQADAALFASRRTVTELRQEVTNLNAKVQSVDQEWTEASRQIVELGADIVRLEATLAQTIKDLNEAKAAQSTVPESRTPFLRMKKDLLTLRTAVKTVMHQTKRWQSCTNAAERNTNVEDNELRIAESADDVIGVVVRRLESATQKKGESDVGSGSSGDDDSDDSSGPGDKKQDGDEAPDDDKTRDASNESSSGPKAGDSGNSHSGGPPQNSTPPPPTTPKEEDASGDNDTASSTSGEPPLDERASVDDANPPIAPQDDTANDAGDAGWPTAPSTPRPHDDDNAVVNSSADSMVARTGKTGLYGSMWYDPNDEGDASTAPPDQYTKQQRPQPSSPAGPDRWEKARKAARENPEKVLFNVPNFHKLSQHQKKILRVQQKEVLKLRGADGSS